MSPLFKGEYLLISDADSVLAAISPFPSFSCAYNKRRNLVAGHASPIHPSSRHSPLPPGAPQLHHPLPQQQHGLLQVHQQQHLLSSPNGAGDTECMALSEVLRARSSSSYYLDYGGGSTSPLPPEHHSHHEMKRARLSSSEEGWSS